MIYKAYRIKKSEYSNLPALLTRIGLVTNNEAAPGQCVVSRKTYKVFEKEMYRLARKQYPNVARRRIMAIVGMELLNLGPARLDKGVEFGYVLTVTEQEALIK